MEATYPLKMKLDDAEIVTAEIFVDPSFVHIGNHPPHVTGVISIETSHSEGKERIERPIGLYEFMSAELTGGNLEITEGDLNPRRRSLAGRSMVWTWTIVGKKPGKQCLTINIFGEVILNSDTYSRVETSLTREIEVINKPWIAQAVGFIGNNIGAILGTGGPIGLLLAFLVYRANQVNQEQKKRIDDLESRIRELEGPKPEDANDSRTGEVHDD